MKKLLNLSSLLFLVLSFSVKGSEYKLNQQYIDKLFQHSLDITNCTLADESHVYSRLFNNTTVDRESAAWLAILGSTCGLHSFYMGHTKFGYRHLIFNIASLLPVMSLIVFALIPSSTDKFFAGVLCSFLLSPVGVILLLFDKIVGVAEGIRILHMSDELFQERVVKRPRYSHEGKPR